VTTLPKAIVEPPLVLDRGDRTPLAGQLAGQIRAAVSGNRLRAGERLPSSRALAASLGVSRTVVTDAYLQLFAEGWLEGRPGSGTYVAQGAAGGLSPARPPPPAPPHVRPPHPLQAPQPGQSPRQARPPDTDQTPDAGQTVHTGLPPHGRGVPGRTPGQDGPAAGRATTPDGPGLASARLDDGRGLAGLDDGRGLAEMRPGLPWVAGIDQAAWRRAWRQAGATPMSRWPDPRGLLTLRTTLCGYLRRSRGLDCTPDHILITRGVANGLSLLSKCLLRDGEPAGIEEPGYPVGRAILAEQGVRVVPCPVDSHGLVTDDLPEDLRLVYVTPAHQYPLGGRLPVPRRQALVAWARAAGALVVEDDYDSEFRYDVSPLPALHGLDPEVVAYLGTTSKLLTPAFGVGWLVARPDLVTVLAGMRETLGDRTDEAAQRAIGAMIDGGDLDRHVRRMRREYARRRDAIVSILGDPAVPATLLGDTAGLHVVLELHRGREERVAAAARDRGVAVHTLRRYFGGPPTAQGLVLGYGCLPSGQVTAAATVLRDILLDLPAG
jgi:GntR family transcriptional regulator / MocR family aminotransferase